jgi:nucleoside-diphosphate-sugar epimerase
MVKLKEKLLITGSDGFLGKNLQKFYKDKYSIFCHTRQDNIDDILYNIKPDIIINAAASIYDYDTMFESNVVLVNSILKYIKLTKSKLIQIGSSAEYGIKNNPSKETDLLEPIMFYAGTKAASTMMCSSFAKEFDLPIVVARPYSLYGIHEKPYRLFNRLYNSFKYNIPMTLNQAVHDFIYIKDFIHGIDILINSSIDKIKGDIVNFGSGIQSSNMDVLQCFKNAFRFSPTTISIDHSTKKFFESDMWVCDTSYSQTKYNFKTKYTLQEGIDDLIKELSNAD